MKTLEQLNWFQLEAEFGRSPQVLDAEKFFFNRKRTLSEENLNELSRLLRHHDERRISNKETFIRDDVDQLLDYLSLIEIGFISGALKMKDVLSAGFMEKYRPLLVNRAVRNYYEEFYTLPLLVSLKTRLMGMAGYQGHGEPKELSGYAQLLALKRVYEHDSDLNAFLWILDGGVVDDSDWSDLRKLAKNEKNFMEVLDEAFKEKDPDERSGLGSAALGCRRFIDFLVDLTEILRGLERHTELRQGIWLNYAYWFDDSDSPAYRRQLEDLFQRFVAWQAEGDDESEKSINRYRQALNYAFSLPAESQHETTKSAKGTRP